MVTMDHTNITTSFIEEGPESPPRWDDDTIIAGVAVRLRTFAVGGRFDSLKGVEVCVGLIEHASGSELCKLSLLNLWRFVHVLQPALP